MNVCERMGKKSIIIVERLQNVQVFAFLSSRVFLMSSTFSSPVACLPPLVRFFSLIPDFSPSLYSLQTLRRLH